MDDVTIVINEWPSMGVLCASSNRCEFFRFRVTARVRIGVRVSVRFRVRVGMPDAHTGVRVWEECRYRNRQEEQVAPLRLPVLYTQRKSKTRLAPFTLG